MTIEDADKIYLEHQRNRQQWEVERRAGLQAVLNAAYSERQVVPLDWYTAVAERSAFRGIMVERLAAMVEKLEGLLSAHHNAAITKIDGDCPLCAQPNVFLEIGRLIAEARPADADNGRTE